MPEETTGPRHLEGSLNGAGLRFAVVASRFNGRLVEPLVDGAVDCLKRHGVAAADVTVVRVPGAWELPLALEELAVTGHFSGLVALGLVVRGETPHFDFVCNECSKGVAAVSLRYRLPIGFGVLTTNDSSQAAERAGGKAGNKGWDAALAALEMVDLIARVRRVGE
jgi:6,7-dimethyl-8-ribityllumazine synthase